MKNEKMNVLNFVELTDEELKAIKGGFWVDALLGGLRRLSSSPTLDQLNGGATRNFVAPSCSPYGHGGTPND
ncbi:ComC/BlpC family leader-containing pheromone/bacteriocin [Lactococcus hircilactis]|uniref:ComC/BlpC family leader-containing pheromone/bacteriocin n=1 Tax=Lactococcus hircilactis TaxID=1494462 RepID=UPI003FA33B84